MKKVIYVGLDVHKESIVVATAPQGDTSVELYGEIGGTLDALDKLIKKLDKSELELRFVAAGVSIRRARTIGQRAPFCYK